MKFPVLLCFLPFTLSVPPISYKMSFYSHVKIKSDVYSSKSTQTQNLFVIQGHGIFVWRVLEVVSIIKYYLDRYFSS